MVNGQCLTTMVTTSWRSSGQDMGFGGLGMANSKSGDYNLFSSGQVLELLRWPQCWFHKIEVSAMYSYIPLGLNQRLNVGVDQWFHICIVNTCQWVYLLVEGLFYGGGGGGSLSPKPWCSEMYDFALVGCESEAIPCRPFLYGIHCLL